MTASVGLTECKRVEDDSTPHCGPAIVKVRDRRQKEVDE